MQDKVGSELLWEIEGPVGVVTFNRPAAHNALTFEMYDRLGEICAAVPRRRLAARPHHHGRRRARLWRRHRHLAVSRLRAPAADGLGYEARMERMFEKVEALPGADHRRHPRHLHGRAAAIAAACDLRLATRNLKFGFPIARTLANCFRPPTSPASPC